jgi:hypothetical protein
MARLLRLQIYYKSCRYALAFGYAFVLQPYSLSFLTGGNIWIDGTARKDRFHIGTNETVPIEKGLYSHANYLQEDQHKVFRQGGATCMFSAPWLLPVVAALMSDL